MHRATLLPGFSLRALANRRAYRVLRSPSTGLLRSTPPRAPTQPSGRTNDALIQYRHPGHTLPQVSFLAKSSDLSTQKYTLIYSLPHIKLLRAISRLKLLQTGITLVILPPVYFLYLQGSVSFYLVSYSSGIALFAGVMLYAVSHFLRRVVGMMYVDAERTTLKVSHLTFWGRRKDVFMPVSDVMPLGEAGDSVGEPILRLKRYSAPRTLYFSTRFGRVVDKPAFEKVFGTLT